MVETEDGGETTATSPPSPLSPSSPSSSPPSSPFHFTMTGLSGPLLRSLNAGASCRRCLRYTCSDVSPNVTPVLEAPDRYLALGTTSGSVHVFQYFGCSDDAADSALQCLKSLRVHDHHNLTAPVVNGQTASTTATTSIQHYLTIIYEDLIGPVTSVAFAPVQLIVSRNNAQTNFFINGNGLSTSASTSSGDDSSSSDLDSSSTLSEQYSSPPPPPQPVANK